MKIVQFIHGTIDFVFGTSIPVALGWLVRRGVQTHVFKDRVQFHNGSPWASKRVTAALRAEEQEQLPAALPVAQKPKKKDELPLWKRAIHVPEEGKAIELEDNLEVQRDVKYVVQEHNAKRAGRHFDLRLVLKDKKGRETSVSWAIPMKGKRAGPLRFPKPGEKWAAIRQPDHDVEYNDFEGTIPDGELGAGTVKIWASGTADVHKIEDGHVHLKILSGPAKGSYVLVSTKGTQGLILSKKPQAVEIWTKPSYTKKPQEILDELERAGGSTAERKVDGASVELRIVDGSPRVFSHRVSKRTGQLVEHTDRLVHLDAARTEGLEDTRVRAEAWHPRGVNFLSGTLNSSPERARQVQRSAGPVRLQIFDITRYKGKDVSKLPYAERRALYEEVAKEMASPHVKPVRSVKTGFSRFYEQQVSLKHTPTDGVVVKRGDMGYDEKPWIKVKPSDLADCTVVGLSEGAGKHDGRLGALTVTTPEEKRVQVGTGFSDWERQWIWDHRDEIPGEVARVDFHVRHGKRTDTGPRFDSWHPDKSENALRMYADVMDVSPYALKSATGWRAAG